MNKILWSRYRENTLETIMEQTPESSEQNQFGKAQHELACYSKLILYLTRPVNTRPDP